MSKKFETLEAAIAHIETLSASITDKDVRIKTLESDVKAAQDIATDAVNKANQEAAKVPGEVTVKIGKDTYVVRFGLDGLTKKELAEDEAKLKELVKKGSGALIKKEA